MKIFVRDKSFYKTVFVIALPIVLQSLITTGVNMMDTLMLTNCGEAPLSGASLANQFIHIFQLMCMGLGFGASVLTARFWGSGDTAGIKKVATLMIRICIVFALVFTTVTLAAPRTIMRIYTPDEAIIEEGVLYLKICAFAFLLDGLSQTLTAVLRSVRQVKLPLITSIIAFFVNIFCNWVFIFGHLGAPALEVRGAALGTLIARIVECGIIAGYFLLLDKRVGYRIRDLFCSCKGYVHDYVRYCVPVLVSDTLLGLGNNMVSVVMGHISANFVAAYAVLSQMTRMFTVLTTGLSNSASVLTGNTLGEGDKEKAYHNGVTFLALSACVGVLVAVVFFVISSPFLSFCNLTNETAEVARQMCYGICVIVLFGPTQGVLTKGVLRGAGDTRFLMITDILLLWCVSVPLGYLTGIVLKMPPYIVYISLFVDWIIKSIWCSFRLFKGKWVNNAVRVQGHA